MGGLLVRLREAAELTCLLRTGRPSCPIALHLPACLALGALCYRSFSLGPKEVVCFTLETRRRLHRLESETGSGGPLPSARGPMTESSEKTNKSVRLWSWTPCLSNKRRLLHCEKRT